MTSAKAYCVRLACTTALLLSVSAFAQKGGENSHADNVFKNTRYLALGDSIPFGFNLAFVPDLTRLHGYPEFVSDSVHRNLANASCPGETSGSFLSLSELDLGCKGYRSAYPLFVSYHGTQLDYAVQYLKSNPNPRLVTINIGGNDLGLLQISCKGDPECALAGLPAVLAKYGANLKRLRSSAAFAMRRIMTDLW